MKRKLTQKERVLKYMRTHKYITAIDGYKKFNSSPITQIHTVIYKLRNDGYDINTKMVTNKKTGERYSKWSLKD